jgi:hypothetical protein
LSAAVGFALALGALVAGTPEVVAAEPVRPGIAVLPDLPEVGVSQFEPGESNFVPPVAPAAADIKSLAGKATGTGIYTCPGFSTVDDKTSVAMLKADKYAWGPYAAYKVGNGSGNINWRLNPYKNRSWYMWFHSLRWLGQGIVAAGKGDTTAMARVVAISKDWVADNPYSWKADAGAFESTMHRTNVLLCLRQAVMAGLGVTALPTAYRWIDVALVNHARFLTANWSGVWNHGTDESIALFGVGCTLNRNDYKATAQNRLAAAITTAIDSQGSTNEQSTAYAQFNYNLWGRAVTALKACGANPGTTITTRRELMAGWLALATNSLGKLHQLGDSEVVATGPVAGTPLAYAGTLGREGTVPVRRIATFKAGYVFGRTGWGETRPFTQESAYSIRYGPSRAAHGHSDHMAITYTSRGRDILIDGGHSGYQKDVWRTWVVSPYAASAMTTPLAAQTDPVTKLTRSVFNPTSEFYEFADVPGTGISRYRAVLVLKNPDLIVTLDRATAKKAQQFQTLWHLPSDQKATVYSRTTAIGMKPGDTTRTILFQVPYRQPLPRGAILVKQGQTKPIQGWHYPNIFTRKSAPTLMFARSGTTASILSVIAPVPAAGSVQYKGRWSGTTYVVDLVVAGVKASFGITPAGSLYRVR